MASGNSPNVLFSELTLWKGLDLLTSYRKVHLDTQVLETLGNPIARSS